MTKEKQIFWKKNAKAVVVFFFIAVFLWLMNMNLALSGKFTAEYDFSKPSTFISHIMPPGRASEIKSDNGEFYQELIGEPVYFEVKAPYGGFATADLTIVYENENQAEIKAGIVVNDDPLQFKLQPIENKALDNMLNDNNWSKVSFEDIIVLQRENIYNSIDEFFMSMPKINEIAIYNYPLEMEYEMEEYTAKKGGVEINQILKGSHEMYTYLNDEILDFSFLVEDTDKSKKDNIDIRLYRNGKRVNQMHIEDDQEAIEKEIFFKSDENLPKGVYKVEIIASSNILINNITTSQDYLAFIDKLYLAGIDQDPASIYTNGNLVAFQTSHVEGLQTLQADDQELMLEKVHEQYLLQLNDGLKEIKVEKNDIQIATDGLFVFSQDQYFNPEITTFSEYVNLNQRGINYILAQYQSPAISDNIKQATVQIDLTGVKQKERKYKFMISAPGLSQKGNIIKVKEIRVEFNR